ncbi:ribonuclease E, partial [Acidithiobacillus ferridurans]|nr:ribonuclease E [Acidithiobacillus ferridurans]
GEGNTLPTRPNRPTNESAALSPLTAPPPPEVLPPLRTPPAPSSPKTKAPAKVVPPEEGILARLVRALVSRYVPVDAATFLAETSGAEMSASTEQANETNSDEQENGSEGRSSGRRRRRGGRRARARRSTQGGENGTESFSADEEVPEESYTTEGFQDNDLLAGPEDDSHVLEELVYPGSVPAAADWHQMLVPVTTRTPVANLTVQSDPAREVESLPAEEPTSLAVQEPAKDTTRESLPVAVRQEPTPEPVQGDLLAVEAIEQGGAESVDVPGDAEQRSFPLGDG